MPQSDDLARAQLADALRSIDDYYRERGIFQERFGFGKTPAVVVVDFAYGWTDEAYAAGSRRLDKPVESTRILLDAARAKKVPVIYTTSPWRPQTGDQPFKSAAASGFKPAPPASDASPRFRPWDKRAVQIDERIVPQPSDYVIEKESASAFAGTHLAGYLVEHKVDTVLITGCSTSACIRATATDAKSFRFRPVIVEECVGDRAAAAHIFTLFDIQARFADVVSLEKTLEYFRGLRGVS